MASADAAVRSLLCFLIMFNNSYIMLHVGLVNLLQCCAVLIIGVAPSLNIISHFSMPVHCKLQLFQKLHLKESFCYAE